MNFRSNVNLYTVLAGLEYHFTTLTPAVLLTLTSHHSDDCRVCAFFHENAVFMNWGTKIPLKEAEICRYSLRLSGLLLKGFYLKGANGESSFILCRGV